VPTSGSSTTPSEKSCNWAGAIPSTDTGWAENACTSNERLLIGHTYLGLHQEKCDQQGKGGDSAPLLCSHETPHGVQTLSVGPTTREGHGAVGAGSGESQDDQRAGASPQSGIG